MDLICPYCEEELEPSGHSSGVCNGWTCPKCNHQEPEMGSYSMAGRPRADLNCYCANCLKEGKRNVARSR